MKLKNTQPDPPTHGSSSPGWLGDVGCLLVSLGCLGLIWFGLIVDVSPPETNSATLLPKVLRDQSAGINGSLDLLLLGGLFLLADQLKQYLRR